MKLEPISSAGLGLQDLAVSLKIGSSLARFLDFTQSPFSTKTDNSSGEPHRATHGTNK
jgi:hypothetical protein